MTDFPSSPVTDVLAGLAERLDRLFLTSEDGQRFVLATESANNIVGIVREWIRSRSHAQPAPEAIQEVAANAIRAFCQNLGANTIVVTGGVERIYYSGLSLDALAVAVALALSSPHHEASK